MNDDIKTHMVGMLTGDMWDKMHESSRRVYATDGVAPTQHTCGGGNLETKILESINNNDMEQQEEPKIGAIRTRSYCGQPAKLEEGGSEHSNCITSVDKDNVVVEPINTTADGLATTLTTAHHYSGNIVNPKRGQTEMGVKETDSNMKFRIRKLTPREAFRLMDMDDADIDKIQAAGISKSRQYCLAGNSICVGVLYHIFRKMFIETENESQQLTLF